MASILHKIIKLFLKEWGSQFTFRFVFISDFVVHILVKEGADHKIEGAVGSLKTNRVVGRQLTKKCQKKL